MNMAVTDDFSAVAVRRDTFEKFDGFSKQEVGVVFADIAVYGEFTFTVDAAQVCSWKDFTRINCVDGVSVTPFTGLAALPGRVIVSGGTGGYSELSVDDTGMISMIQSNKTLGGVVGLPDVVAIDDETLAFSVDYGSFRSLGNTGRFGTLLMKDGEVTDVFTVNDSLNFDLNQRPASFPLVNAAMTVNGTQYLYIANGALQVHDLESTEMVEVDMGEGVLALTVAANPERREVMVGTVIAGGTTWARRRYSVQGTTLSLEEEVRTTSRMWGMGSRGEKWFFLTGDGLELQCLNGATDSECTEANNEPPVTAPVAPPPAPTGSSGVFATNALCFALVANFAI